jgi:hypothetical protein
MYRGHAIDAKFVAANGGIFTMAGAVQQELTLSTSPAVVAKVPKSLLASVDPRWHSRRLSADTRSDAK